MYHYLKWATIGLFLRRNLRFLVLIVVGVIGIYLADAVYHDLADLAYKTGQPEKISAYLAVKWLVVVGCGAMILFSVTRLGFSGESKRKRSPQPDKKERSVSKKEAIAEDDPYMKRLEKFRGSQPLRKRSDLVLQKKRRRFGRSRKA